MRLKTWTPKAFLYVVNGKAKIMSKYNKIKKVNPVKQERRLKDKTLSKEAVERRLAPFVKQAEELTKLQVIHKERLYKNNLKYYELLNELNAITPTPHNRKKVVKMAEELETIKTNLKELETKLISINSSLSETYEIMERIKKEGP